MIFLFMSIVLYLLKDTFINIKIAVSQLRLKVNNILYFPCIKENVTDGLFIYAITISSYVRLYIDRSLHTLMSNNFNNIPLKLKQKESVLGT